MSTSNQINQFESGLLRAIPTVKAPFGEVNGNIPKPILEKKLSIGHTNETEAERLDSWLSDRKSRMIQASVQNFTITPLAC